MEPHYPRVPSDSIESKDFGLGQDFFYHIAMHIGQAEVAAGIIECQAFMVQAE